MLRFRDLRVRTRMFMGFGAVLVLVAAIVVIGTQRLSTIDRIVTETVGPDWAKSRLAGTVMDRTDGTALASLPCLSKPSLGEVGLTMSWRH